MALDWPHSRYDDGKKLRPLPGEPGGAPGIERFDFALDASEELILLPAAGLDAEGGPAQGLLDRLHWLLVRDGVRFFAVDDEYEIGDERWLRPVENPDDAQIHLIASAFPTGPKLVQVSPDVRQRLRIDPGPLRLAPNCRYQTVSSHPGPTPSPTPGSAGVLTVQVVDATSGQAVPGAVVELFEDVPHAIGDRGTSDGAGSLDLRVACLPLKVERLYVTPPSTGYWGSYTESFTINSSPYQVSLEPVAATHIDAARYVYQSAGTSGTGVRVGVVDHGIDAGVVPVAGGTNLVLDEPDDDHGDDGTGHGTHVAGIIANSQTGGPSGLAPAAKIFSYRVFGTEASSFSVLMAVYAATKVDDCHLINLSIGGLAYDTVLRDMDIWAANHGAVLLAATGNDWGGDVTIPASLSSTLAVAAVGRVGTFPSGSIEEAYIGPRSAIDADNFFAAFANYLPRGAVDLVAPGIGILSVRAGGGYGPLSGTSQACAVATGAAARALTGTSWLTDPANLARSTALKNHLISTARTVGLTPRDLEGSGLLS